MKGPTRKQLKHKHDEAASSWLDLNAALDSVYEAVKSVPGGTHPTVNSFIKPPPAFIPWDGQIPADPGVDPPH